MKDAANILLIIYLLANAYILYKFHRDNRKADEEYDRKIKEIYASRR